MASILQTKHYDLLAEFWKQVLYDAEALSDTERAVIEMQYVKFTNFMFYTQDNFRVSYFDEAVGYERTE